MLINLGHNKGKKIKPEEFQLPKHRNKRNYMVDALDNLQEMETEKQNEVQYDEKETQTWWWII